MYDFEYSRIPATLLLSKVEVQGKVKYFRGRQLLSESLFQLHPLYQCSVVQLTSKSVTVTENADFTFT